MAKLESKDTIVDAYESVRNDSNETNWCCLKFQEEEILHLKSFGESFDDLALQLQDDERAFVYLRLQTGDEMSKRQKFAFITWIGQNVSALKRAKMSTAKADVKQVWPAFAVEMSFDDLEEFKEDNIRNEIIRAGGANYGTGQ